MTPDDMSIRTMRAVTVEVRMKARRAWMMMRILRRMETCGGWGKIRE